MLVHGGGYSRRETEFYAMANLLAQRGYAVFLPEYRRSPEAPYPAGLIDVNDALAWVKAQAGTYGVDRDHIALGGGSSGGQMAALLAYTSNTSLFKTHANDDTRVNALFDLDGVLNFTSAGAPVRERRGRRFAGCVVAGGRRSTPRASGGKRVRPCMWMRSPRRHRSSAAGRLRLRRAKTRSCSNSTRHSSPVPRTRECSAHLLALRAAPEQGGR